MLLGDEHEVPIQGREDRDHSGENQPLLASTKFAQDDHNTDVGEPSNSSSSFDRPPPPPPPTPLPPSNHRYGAQQSSAISSTNKSIRDSRAKIGSLDFERVVNEYSIQASYDRLLLKESPYDEQQKQQHDLINTSKKMKKSIWRGKRMKEHYTGRTPTRWALSAGVGLLTGMTAMGIVAWVEYIVQWRKEKVDALAQDPNVSTTTIFIMITVANLVLAVCASLLCVAWVPGGVGSGIPEVKAYLNGCRIKRFTSWSLFIVKIFGTVLSVSSSLAIGMEGPLVHIGAIIGASFTKLSSVLSKFLSCWTTTSARVYTNNNNNNHVNNGDGASTWAQKLWSWSTKDLSHFATDAERRDLVSIGASVGFAASFGAPIGGLLFILDDISSYFSKNMFLRTLVANAIGTFCLAWNHHDLSNYSIINLGSYTEPNTQIFLNRFKEVPLYILVGTIGGALGGIFCGSFEFLKRNLSDRSPAKGRHKWQLLEVAMLSIITSTLLFFCQALPWACKQAITEKNNHHDGEIARQFFCEPGQVNEMATLSFGSRDTAIKRILADPTNFQQETLWTVGIVFYVLMTITYGSTLPSGIFTPSVLIGASLGGAAGLFFQAHVDSEITPATFALLGVASLLAGIQRSTVSLCVILVEGTGQIKVLLPVIITTVVARYVAEFFHVKGLYETSMDLKKYPFLDHDEKKRYDIFEVRDIMNCPVVTVGPREQACTLVKLLRDFNHHGFPVVDPTTKQFLGLIRRDQIIALIECGVFEEASNENPSSEGESSHSGMTSPAATKLNKSAQASPAWTPTSQSHKASPAWTPIPNSHKTPLMHWAYHINDDRFDQTRYKKQQQQQQQRPKMSSRSAPLPVKSFLSDNEDEFDNNSWLHNIHSNMGMLPLSSSTLDDEFSIAGDDSLPTLTAQTLLTASWRPPTGKSQVVDPYQSISSCTPPTYSSARSSNSHSISAPPTGFAEVGMNQDGSSVLVSWLDPAFRHHWVNIAAVMNRGTYCITESCPLSKAYALFTSLGLRHIVVLGGSSGGEVVGIFSRANLLQSSIEERTGTQLY